MVTRIEQAEAAVEAARAVLTDLGSLAGAPHQELVALLGRAAELSRIVDAQQVRLAGEIDERSKGPADVAMCRRLGQRSAKEAVAVVFGIRGRDAQGLLNLASATTPTAGFSGGEIAIKYPRVAQALGAGQLSLAQAQAIVGTLDPVASRADLDQLAWAEGVLVDAATDPDAPLVPELLVTQARAYVLVLDPDGVLPDAERQRAMRSFQIWQQADGIWKFRGTSPPEEGSALKALLDAYASPRVKVAFRDDDEDPDIGRDVDLNGQPNADGITVVDDRSLEQKQHDVLLGLVRAHAASGDAPTAGGEPPTLVFTGTIEAYNAYLHDLPTPERTLTIEHTGAQVPIETIDRLLCDALVQKVVMNDCSHTLQLGMTQRLFSRAQRRALAARDKGCRVPGCGLPAAWCEAHHVVFWEDDGPTDIDNGILVCSYHHHEIHAGRLRVEPAGPEPGNWRIVPEFRPADRYARAYRTGDATGSVPAETSIEQTVGQATGEPVGQAVVVSAPRPGPSTDSLAAAAIPSLARRLPDAAPATRPPRRGARTRQGRVEQRLRRLVDRHRGPASPAPALAPRPPAFDLRPPAHIVMRT